VLVLGFNKHSWVLHKVTFPLSAFCNQQIGITGLAKGPVVCDKKISGTSDVGLR